MFLSLSKENLVLRFRQRTFAAACFYMTLITSVLQGCKAKESEETPAPSTETITHQRDDISENLNDKNPLTKNVSWKITERQRMEAPGFVFGVAIQGDEGVAATRGEGAGGVYWVSNQGLKASAVGGGGGWPISIGGDFAILGQDGTLRVMKEGAVQQKWSIGRGALEGLVEADGLWWTLDRRADAGLGLLGFDSKQGEVKERIETGEGVPVGLFKIAQNPSSTTLAVLVGIFGGEPKGAIVLVHMENGQPKRVRREPITGMPLAALSNPSSRILYVTRHMAPDLAVIDAQTGVTLGIISLGVVPSQAILSQDASRMWVLSGQGELLKIKLTEDGKNGTVEQRLKLNPGSSQLEAWEGDNPGLLLLDRHGQALRWLDPETLEERTRLPLLGTVGRMAVDQTSRQVLVSLPELEQLVWAVIERQEQPKQ